MRIALRGWRFASCPGTLFDYTPAENSLSSQFHRMATAECMSYEDIGKLAGFDTKTISKRKIAVANHYVREFIGVRDRAAARKMILSTGIFRISPGLLFGAFCPDSVLRIRKAIRAGFSKRALSAG
jgi:hypothetical protein